MIHLQLKIEPKDLQLKDTGDAKWLDLLRRFSAVQTLRVTQELARRVALALADATGAMVVEVLPLLNLICLAGRPASTIEKFIAVHWLSGYIVTVIETEREFERLKSHVIGKVLSWQAGVDKRDLLIVNLVVDLCPIYSPLS